MRAGEVATSAGLVRSLVADQFPYWRSLPVEPVVERGTDNDLYRLGDELVVRLPRGERRAQALVDECRWLPRLAPRLPLAVPEPVVVGRPAEVFPFPWAILRWVPGEQATADRVDDRLQLARDLAGFVHALQLIGSGGGPRPRPANVFRGAPLATREQATRTALDRLPADVDRSAAVEVWERALAAPEWDGRPVWLHGDLDERNLLAVDARLAGAVDWGTVAIGDPACDAAAGWKLLDAAGLDAFRDALDLDDATWSRARGWALSQAAVALTTHAEAEQPVLVAAARRWLAAALAG